MPPVVGSGSDAISAGSWASDGVVRSDGGEAGKDRLTHRWILLIQSRASIVKPIFVSGKYGNSLQRRSLALLVMTISQGAVHCGTLNAVTPPAALFMNTTVVADVLVGFVIVKSASAVEVLPDAKKRTRLLEIAYV